MEVISEDYYLSHSDSALYTDAALITTIENWARAWSEQDVERYLSHYSESFKPSNQSLDEWKNQQFRRIQWREFIIVKPSRIKVKVRGERATARFRQYYKSNLAEHINCKTLTFQLEGGRWRITSDQS